MPSLTELTLNNKKKNVCYLESTSELTSSSNYCNLVDVKERQFINFLNILRPINETTCFVT